MSYYLIVYVGSFFLAIVAALAALAFLTLGFLGQRGDSRTQRFRVALSSVLVFIAAAISAVSMFFYLVGPGTMQGIRPDFSAPYGWSTKLFSAIAPLLIFLAAGFGSRALCRSRGTRKRLLQTSLCCFLLFLTISAANYVVFFFVQVPAFQRYVMIEGRDWQTHIGQPAPDISVSMLDGSQVRLSSLRGNVVLLNFFATWCGPCQYELPHLQTLWTDLKANPDFRMLVVGREETDEAVAAFKIKAGFTFPMAIDPDASAFGKFAKEGIPRTYLIARDGTILFQSLGFADTDLYEHELAQLRQAIDKELAASP